MKKILFVCVHNAGRSQMAEALFNRLAGSKGAATSAGTEPSLTVNPTVSAVMREISIDIGKNKPKLLTIAMMQDADRVITMGCGAEKVCPASLAPTEDWQLEDPEGKPIERVRQIRDEIKIRVEKLITEL